MLERKKKKEEKKIAMSQSDRIKRAIIPTKGV